MHLFSKAFGSMLFTFGLLAGTPLAAATVISWNNPLGGDWDEEMNWDPQIVPGAEDTVMIDLLGIYTVTLNVNASVAGFTLDAVGATFSATGKSLVLNGPAVLNSGSVIWTNSTWRAAAGGPLANNALLTTLGNSTLITTLINNGTIDVSGGTLAITPSGPVPMFTNTTNAAISVEGSLVINGGTAHFEGGMLTGTATLINSTLSFASGADVSGSPAFNLSGGILSGDIPTGVNVALLGGGGLTGVPAAGDFTNYGTLTLAGSTGGGGIVLDVPGQLINEGTINLEVGLGDGLRELAAELKNNGVLNVNTMFGQLQKAGAQHVNNADIIIAGGKKLTVIGTMPQFTNSPSGAILVAGSLVVEGGTLHVEGGTLTGTTTLNNSTLSFASGADVSGSPAFNLPSGGILSGDIPTGVNVALLGGGGLTGVPASGGFTNYGTLTLEGSMGGGGIVLDVPGQLINEGTINLEVGLGDGLRELAAELENNGVLNVNTMFGQLQKAGAQHVNNADIIIAGGKKLTVIQSGTMPSFTNSPSGLISVAGSMIMHDGSFHHNRATIDGGGTLWLYSMTSFADQGDEPEVVNIVLEWGSHFHPGSSPGLFGQTGDFEERGNFLDIELAGTLPGISYDQLNVSGIATLDGQLNISYPGGYLPHVGQLYTIVTYGSQTGCFGGGVTGLTTPGGLTLVPDCGPTAYTLLVTGIDCNNNGIADDDEIAGCMGDPACDDCNGNSIPDECDIAECPPEMPACDDCNLSGVPDACDIADMTSLDVDMNGIPDECVDFIGGCGEASPEWSCPANWELDGDIPSNDARATYSVTLDQVDDVFLDISISIDTLRILENATLRVTQGTNFKGAGELSLVEAGGLLNRGNLFVANDRVIDASAGAVVIGEGGLYEADPEAAGEVSATLTAGSIEMLEGPPGQAGTMILTDSMAVVSQGRLLLLNNGSCFPPDLRVLNNASLMVNGGFEIVGAASIEYTSTEPLVLQGSFANQSIDPLIFDWLGGGLLMSGSGGEQFADPSEQTIEAAGQDRGPYQFAAVDNFAFGSLTLASGSDVAVIDAFDNQQDGALECEALYVTGTLTIEPGAVLDVSAGCNVYYGQLDNQGTIIDPASPSVIQILSMCQQADFNSNGGVDAADLALLLGGWGNPGCNGNLVCLPDLNLDLAVNPIDLAFLLGIWGPCP